MYSWWWVRLSPKTCRVKPMRRIKTQLLHLVGLISLLFVRRSQWEPWILHKPQFAFIITSVTLSSSNHTFLHTKWQNNWPITHTTQHNDSTTQAFTFSGDECHIMWCNRIFPGAFDESTASIQGHAVVQLVEALHYKPEDRGFNSRWCRNFSSTSSRTMATGLTQPLTNEYQEYFLGDG
jgi:hypothetical protein